MIVNNGIPCVLYELGLSFELSDFTNLGCVGTSVKIPVDATCFDVVRVGKDCLDVLAASAQFNEIKIYPSGTVYKTEKSDCLSLHFTKVWFCWECSVELIQVYLMCDRDILL